MHKAAFLFLIVFVQTFYLTFSQTLNPETTEYRYWIYFKDKGIYKPGDKLEPGSDGYKLAVANLSDKAIWRRSKVLGKDQIAGYIDLPVSTEYIDKIKALGVNPHSVSKWFNAISVNAVKGKIDEIKKLLFVEKIEGVHFLEKSKIQKSIIKSPYIPENITGKTKYNYGGSYWQNQQISVPELHNYGITGYGVTIGMCDDGFNWRNHEAL